MIYLAYGDCSLLLKSEKFSRFFENLSPVARVRVQEPARAQYRAYRLMEHLMLEAFCKKGLCAISPEEIRIAEQGKPYFENGPAFSISHDKYLVAIALTNDFQSIGVDIQSQPNPVTASRVRRRFLTPLPPYRKGAPEVNFMMAHVENEGIDLTPAHPFGTPSTFLCDYVRAEAVMKYSGGGFADFPRLHSLCEECETAVLPLGETAIALAYG